MLVACGGQEGGPDAGAADPQAATRDYERALADAPPSLARLYAQGDRLLPGGLEAYEQKLAALRGFPVVVNVWASWCGPCRAEFPYFQSQSAKQGDRVAFLGVDTQDVEAAAETFLEDYPVPYPSVSDPDGEVEEELGVVGIPATAFYDEKGELVYLKQGPYTAESELATDIERYAAGSRAPPGR